LTRRSADSFASWSKPGSSETDSPRTAVIYLRVSTKDQAFRNNTAEGLSLPAQREACQRKADSLGATIVEEFVERGESAKTANRAELQRLLTFVKDNPVDYVIVHKVDRWARRVADDVQITLAIRSSGATLVSCVEGINETPSGIFLHHVMSAMAEYDNRNRAAEVMKGLVQKAKNGGTPGKAPLGYLNVRKVENYREVRTVEVDPERGPLIAWAFEAYATGNWSTRALLDELNARGLTTLPSATKPAAQLSWSHIPELLANPYYKGTVRYMDVEYDGRHPRLVTPQVWQRVQEVLADHRNGEKQRSHRHYLKSSLYCGRCGSRLIVTNAKSGSGRIYPYFICIGRHQKRNDCTLKAVPIDVVEELVAEHYATIQLEPELREAIEQQLQRDLIEHYREAKAERARLAKERVRLMQQSAKLLERHYDDLIPGELFAQEQRRIKQRLVQIDERLARSQDHEALVAVNLRRALELASDCYEAYATAPDRIRRLMNQAFFKAIYVDDDEHVRSELAAPFDVLLTKIVPPTTATTNETLAKQWWQAVTSESKRRSPRGPSPRGHPRRPSKQVTCLKDQVLVERAGIEPATSGLQSRRSPS
jgi:site-specific DNA recombinase